MSLNRVKGLSGLYSTEWEDAGYLPRISLLLAAHWHQSGLIACHSWSLPGEDRGSRAGGDTGLQTYGSPTIVTKVSNCDESVEDQVKVIRWPYSEPCIIFDPLHAHVRCWRLCQQNAGHLTSRGRHLPGYRLEVANVLWLPVSRYQIIPVRYTGVYRYLKCELICIEEIKCWSSVGMVTGIGSVVCKT